MSGWIKIHRKFLDWEWFNKSEAVHLFIYLVLKANHKDGQWQGIDIKKGQFVTSFGKISSDTGISLQTIRTLLKKFEKTNEINTQTTNKYTIITICKYECYQQESEQPNTQLTNKQQTTNKQLTTNKNDKKENKYIYSFESSLCDYGFDSELVKQWLMIRKQKKAVNSEIAFNGFIREVEKSHLPKNEILKLCIEKSWKGFEANWVEQPKQEIRQIDFNEQPNKFPWQ